MFKFEAALIPKNEIVKSRFAHHCALWSTLLTVSLAVAAFFSAFMLAPELVSTNPVLIALLALITARLFALDLMYMVLPDIYTIPLTVFGLIVPVTLGWQGFWEGAIAAGLGFTIPFVLALFASWLKGDLTGIGGGDIKLMAAVGAWLGPVGLPLCITIACLFTLTLSIMRPARVSIPFGPGLCVAFWIVFLYKEELLTLINSLSLPI